MFDARLLPIQHRLLGPPARALHHAGIGADAITLAGFGIGLLACLAAMAQIYWLALILLILNRTCDGLDGAVARLAGPSDRGAFLDIALDFWFYSLFPMSFAIADPEANALAAAVLVTTFGGTGSSFLAFSIIAEKRGLAAGDYPSKGSYYLGGLTEGAETIGVLVAFCLFPNAFAYIAWVYAALCSITTLTRWLAGWQAFASTPKNSGAP